MYSTDAINWTAVPFDMSMYHQWYGLVYGADKFVAAAPDGIMWSSDGITWSDEGVTIPSNASSSFCTNSDRPLAYGNDTYVMITNTGDNRVMYSPDGLTWTAVV